MTLYVNMKALLLAAIFTIIFALFDKIMLTIKLGMDMSLFILLVFSIPFLRGEIPGEKQREILFSYSMIIMFLIFLYLARFKGTLQDINHNDVVHSISFGLTFALCMEIGMRAIDWIRKYNVTQIF